MASVLRASGSAFTQMTRAAQAAGRAERVRHTNFARGERSKRCALEDASLRFLDPDPPVFHRAKISLETDRPRRREFQRGLEHLAVARAMRHAVLHHDDDFV